MSIQNFYQNAARNDFARLFQFRIASWQVDGVELLGAGGFADPLYYVETASLPGKTINNVQVPYMGLSFNVPGTVSYPGSTGWNVTFRCDADYGIRSVLESELSRIFSVGSTTGDYSLPFTSSRLTLELLGKGTQGNGILASVRSYTLVGVYLAGLGDTQYDVKDTGQIATIQATVAYQYWQAEAKSKNATPPGNSSAAANPFPVAGEGRTLI